jgi:phosphonate transport system permease protein
MKMASQEGSVAEQVKALRRARPRDRFVRVGLSLFGLLLLASWGSSEFQLREFDWERRLQNCQRFLDNVLPFPLRAQPEAAFVEKLSMAGAWWSEMWKTYGREAFAYTVGLSVVAIVLAGVGSLLTLPVASRRFSKAAPLLPTPGGERPWRRWAWRGTGWGSRFFLVLCRSVPEYMIAFFLVVALGFNAWPAVLALAIHNAGILGRLGSELVDNAPAAVPATHRALGGGRWQIYGLVSVPALFSKFLIFFFYRWETCVRDATVLGMLGIPTFGYYFLEARAKDRLDEMLFFVVLGSVAVLLGDFLSYLVRARLERAQR